MGWPRAVAWLRHAESQGNILSVEERARWDKPTHDYRLTKRGRNQAKITAQYLRENFCPFDAFYSSHYLRARETLSIMYPEAEVLEDSRLREANRGIWHTMTPEEIAKNFPHEIERKEKYGLYDYKPFGGEDWPDIEMRIHSFLNTLNCYHEGENVLVIVHGNWFNLFRKVNDHLPKEEVLRRYSLDNHGVVDNASVTIYKGKSVNGKPRLVLEKENIVPWKDRLCPNCYGRGEALERDEDGEGVHSCYMCQGTGLSAGGK